MTEPKGDDLEEAAVRARFEELAGLLAQAFPEAADLGIMLRVGGNFLVLTTNPKEIARALLPFMAEHLGAELIEVRFPPAPPAGPVH